MATLHSCHAPLRTYTSLSGPLHAGRTKNRGQFSVRFPSNAFPVFAKKKKEQAEVLQNVTQLCENMQKQLMGMRSEVIKLQEQEEAMNRKSPVDIDHSAPLNILESVLNQILDRQERFFREEREHWLTERANWQEQEKNLREEISRLQALLSFTTPSASLPDTQIPEQPEVSVIDEIRDKEVTGHPESVANLITAAISAVDQEDVLSEDFENLLRDKVNGVSFSKKEDAVEDIDVPIETRKSPPTGPPPMLTSGDDDIYWVSQLQHALNQKGYFCGDDDAEDFYFGETTLSALLTFQACQGLQETGTTDQETWEKLLGPEMKPVIGNVQEKNVKEEPECLDPKEEISVEFPVLSEMDGGREVHCLQVLLEIAGFSCGKDDMEWWHYGDGTINAIKTFQACNGLPESGVADEKTWKVLAGSENTMAEVVTRVSRENIFEEDMTNNERVWLLGEQRWERKL